MNKFFLITSPAFFAELISLLIALITLPLIINHFSIEQYTTFSTIFIMIYFCQFISRWGLDINANEDIPKSKNTHVFNQYFTAKIYTQIFSIVIFLIGFQILIDQNDLFLVSVFFCICITSNQNFLIQSIGKLHKIIKYIIFLRIIFLFIFLNFIKYMNIQSLIFAFSILHFFISLVSIIFLIKLNYLKINFVLFYSLETFLLIKKSTKSLLIFIINNQYLSLIVLYLNSISVSNQIVLLNFLVQIQRPISNLSDMYFRLSRISFNLGALKPKLFEVKYFYGLILTFLILVITFGEQFFNKIYPFNTPQRWLLTCIFFIIIFVNVIYKSFSYEFLPKFIDFEFSQKIQIVLSFFLLFPLSVAFFNHNNYVAIFISIIFTYFLILLINLIILLKYKKT